MIFFAGLVAFSSSSSSNKQHNKKWFVELYRLNNLHRSNCQNLHWIQKFRQENHHANCQDLIRFPQNLRCLHMRFRLISRTQLSTLPILRTLTKLKITAMIPLSSEESSTNQQKAVNNNSTDGCGSGECITTDHWNHFIMFVSPP